MSLTRTAGLTRLEDNAGISEPCVLAVSLTRARAAVREKPLIHAGAPTRVPCPGAQSLDRNVAHIATMHILPLALGLSSRLSQKQDTTASYQFNAAVSKYPFEL